MSIRCLAAALLLGATEESSMNTATAAAPPIDLEAPAALETATFALGWFWGPDAQFGALPGVWRTRVGYAGGTLANPTYHRLGDHTESFQVDFDPKATSYEALLEVFWKSHNPCGGSWNRQYMSAVFYHSDVQKKAAEAARDRVAEKRGPVKTPILPVGTFTRAEDYHQKYELRGERELGPEFAALFKTDAEFVNSTAVARANAAVAGRLPRERLLKEVERYGLSDAGRARLLGYAR